MAEFQIRAARMEDVAAVVALDRATELLPHWAEAEYLVAVVQADGGVRRRLYVAESAGGLVGFAMGKTVVAGDDVVAELESVAVAKDARRTGVANALCSAVLGWARESGAGEIEIEVRSGNSGAILLYERLGFSAVGRRPGYYREPEDDAVLMRLVPLNFCVATRKRVDRSLPVSLTTKPSRT